MKVPRAGFGSTGATQIHSNFLKSLLRAQKLFHFHLDRVPKQHKVTRSIQALTLSAFSS